MVKLKNHEEKEPISDLANTSKVKRSKRTGTQTVKGRMYKQLIAHKNAKKKGKQEEFEIRQAILASKLSKVLSKLKKNPYLKKF